MGALEPLVQPQAWPTLALAQGLQGWRLLRCQGLVTLVVRNPFLIPRVGPCPAAPFWGCQPAGAAFLHVLMKLKDPGLLSTGCRCYPSPHTAGTLARHKSPLRWPCQDRASAPRERPRWRSQLRGSGRVPAALLAGWRGSGSPARGGLPRRGTLICSGCTGRCPAVASWDDGTPSTGAKGRWCRAALHNGGERGSPAPCQLRGVSRRRPCHPPALPSPSWLAPAGIGVAKLLGPAVGAGGTLCAAQQRVGPYPAAKRWCLLCTRCRHAEGERSLRATSPGGTRDSFCPSVYFQTGMSPQAALQPICWQLPRGCDGADPAWAPASIFCHVFSQLDC